MEMERLDKELEKLTEALKEIEAELEAKKKEVRELEDRLLLFNGAIQGFNLAKDTLEPKEI